MYLSHEQLIRAAFFFRHNFQDEFEWNDRIIGLIGACGVRKTTIM